VTNYRLLAAYFIRKNYSSFVSDDEQYAEYNVRQKIWFSKRL